MKKLNIIVWIIALSTWSYYFYMKHENNKYIEHLNYISNYKHNNLNKLFIDERLLPIFNEFKNDAIEYNNDINYDYLDEIVIDNLDGKGGYTEHYNCDENHTHYRIVIDEDRLNDLISINFVFYHEMGHYMGLLHTYCDERLIMNYYYNINSCNSIDEEVDWEATKVVFFKWCSKYEIEYYDCYKEI